MLCHSSLQFVQSVEIKETRKVKTILKNKTEAIHHDFDYIQISNNQECSSSIKTDMGEQWSRTSSETLASMWNDFDKSAKTIQ